MYQTISTGPRSGFMLCAALVLAMLGGAPAAVSAATIVYFDFDGPAGGFENAPDAIQPGIATPGWIDAAGTLTDFAGNPGRALAARQWFSGNALSLAFTLDPGVSLDLDGFAFDQRASASGATQWRLLLDDTELASGLTTTMFSAQFGSLGVTGLDAPFRIRLEGSGGASDGGTWRIDNFYLLGTLHAVPVPPAVWLFGSALGWLAWPRRRHRGAG